MAVPAGAKNAGWATIGGKRNYYRSKWEKNYARYLELLKTWKQIADWEHEPETFWFEGIRRGTCSYKPDFRVTENGGSVSYHEVKGFMTARSKTALARMARYHPKIKIRLVDKKGYYAIASYVKKLIRDWE